MTNSGFQDISLYMSSTHSQKSHILPQKKYILIHPQKSPINMQKKPYTSAKNCDAKCDTSAKDGRESLTIFFADVYGSFCRCIGLFSECIKMHLFFVNYHLFFVNYQGVAIIGKMQKETGSF